MGMLPLFLKEAELCGWILRHATMRFSAFRVPEVVRITRSSDSGGTYEDDKE